MYGRIFTGLLACVVLGCSLLVTALIAGENRILLRPGLDPRGKQFYVNRLQAFCEQLECHTCPSGAVCFELTCNQNMFLDPTHRRSILLCHGNAGTALDFEPLLNKFTKLFDTIYIVEYRGYGCASTRSSAVQQSSISPKDLVEDLREIMGLLETSRRQPVTVLLGYSIGGGVITQWLRQSLEVPEPSKYHPIQQVVCLNSFASIPQLVDEHVPWFSTAIKSVMQCQWNTAKALQFILQVRPEMKVLWVNTRDDHLIGTKHTDAIRHALSESRTENIVFVELPNGDHAGSVFVHSEEWMSKLLERPDETSMLLRAFGESNSQSDSETKCEKTTDVCDK